MDVRGHPSEDGSAESLLQHDPEAIYAVVE
jgi:hypothetical protein